jgi:hypothetical protein
MPGAGSFLAGRWVLSLVLGVALVLNLGVAFKLGVQRPMQSDSFYFLCIAKSLAQGHGYILPEGFWPDAPTMSRAPGWPAVVSLGLRLFPGANPDALMRVTAALLNTMAAGLVAWLAWVLFHCRWTALCSGLAYALYPVALYEADEGTSEVLFITLAMAGTLLALKRDWRRPAGFLTLGTAALVRQNFLVWIGFAGCVWMWQRFRGADAWFLPGRDKGQRFRSLAAPLAAVLLFLLPSLLWAARNYRACGHFPVLSTLRGQTFYGGNNSVVADTLDAWGYWIFPNSVPGERTMYDLSRTMSEYEVDVYYFNKGRTWIREHASAMPRLVLGKLIRAYVPVPWKLSVKSALVGGCRGVLYLLGVAGLVMAWRRLPAMVRMTLPAMALANVLTVVMFWGCARFAFEIEPFMIPFAVAACLAWFRHPQPSTLNPQPSTINPQPLTINH